MPSGPFCNEKKGDTAIKKEMVEKGVYKVGDRIKRKQYKRSKKNKILKPLQNYNRY